MTDSGIDKLRQVISEWQKGLLQLDRRNNLLFFKTTTKSAVWIDHSDPDQLVKDLVESRTGLSFAYAEKRRRAGTEQEANIFIKEGDLKTEQHDPLDLQKRLRNLSNRAREFEEEQGISVLYIAIGFLKWFDDQGEEATSPLLLLPCTLSHSGPREPFYVNADSDDFEVNGTLSHKLNLLTGKSLPDMEEECSLVEYLNSVAGLFVEQKDWQVLPHLILTTFTYSKLAMWEDLEQMATDAEPHPLVQQLAGETTPILVRDATPSTIPSDEDLVAGLLDDHTQIRDQCTVLGADYSQIICVEKVRAGTNLIIHGPPGTGKSQTIANIIASLIADKKSVLFVSEKTAALDVVKRRLNDCNLGLFCLDLHSSRGKKDNVYEQLRTALDDPQELSNRAFAYDQLTKLRSELNQLVRELHVTREPFGKSIYYMHGQLAAVIAEPDVRIKPISAQLHPEQLTINKLESVVLLAQKIANRPEEFQQHKTSVWRCLKDSVATVGLPDRIGQKATSLSTAVNAIIESAAHASNSIGINEPRDFAGCRQLRAIVEHLSLAPQILPTWLAKRQLEEIQPLANTLAPLYESLSTLEKQTSAFFHSAPDKKSALLALEATNSILNQSSELEQLLGSNWITEIFSNSGTWSIDLQTVKESVEQLLSESKLFVEELMLPTPISLTELQSNIKLAQHLLDVGVVSQSLTSPAARRQLIDRLKTLQSLKDQLQSYRQKLAENYSNELTTQVDKEMLIRWRTDHQSWFATFKQQYKSDHRILKGQKNTSSKITADEAIATIELALNIKELEIELRTHRLEVDSLIPQICEERDPDWSVISSRIESIDLIIDTAFKSGHDLAPLLADPERQSKIGGALTTLRRSLTRFEALTVKYPALKEQSFDTLSARLPKEIANLKTFDESMRAVGLRPTDQRTISDINTHLELSLQHREVEDTISELIPEAERLLGKLFTGTNTEWNEIQEAIKWCNELLQLTDAHVPEGLAAEIAAPKPPETYKQLMSKLDNSSRVFLETIESLSDMFEETHATNNGWLKTDFDQLKIWSRNLSDQSNSAIHWVQYQTAVRSLSSELGPSIIDDIRMVTDDALNVPRIIKRRLVIDWLEYIYTLVPQMREFAAVDHNDLIERFRQLDHQELPQAASNEVRKRGFERLRSSQAAAGKGMILGQIAKKRKRLPIRKLIARCSEFIQALKPCFMMSPLAVSQLLPRQTSDGKPLLFDVLIFDEASQIFPEDSIPAISRARQVIVAGDERQLPPTSFFKRLAENDAEDEDDEEDSNNNLQDVKSILDGLKKFIGQSFDEQYLRVHYRSKSDDLIRFSNDRFYGNRLLVFPSAVRQSNQSGIIDYFVEDGRFDAGSTRRNAQEAQKVVELVVDHMTNRPPSETLGVVALSRAQATYIYDLLQQVRQDTPHLEQWFKTNSQEPFFVKNLENVQGDERDHIIFSIGYGPTVATNKAMQRFGPINGPGGQYRLNVAITRARKTLSVVHSLRSGDITSEQPGARLLSQFLSYIQDPNKFFEGQVGSPTGDIDSEFEQSVLQALTNKGYIVHSQVGCAGYWIDLAILSENGMAYDIGIECDGAAYHSSPAARDRDWLRQSILEELGWTIHRVWSTSWIRDPDYELSRIVNAIEMARVQGRTKLITI